MDAAAFEQVYGAFGDFHAYFAPLFGRRETQDHSRHYLLGAVDAVRGAAQRRKSVGDGSGLSQGDAAVSHRIAVG